MPLFSQVSGLLNTYTSLDETHKGGFSKSSAAGARDSDTDSSDRGMKTVVYEPKGSSVPYAFVPKNARKPATLLPEE
jgi:hypothetical protein